MNVVLITIDSLRKDHLPIYGYPHSTAPSLSTFAQEAVVFDRMYSQYICTPPSMASLMTGRYPSFVGVKEWNLDSRHGLTRFYSRKKEYGIPDRIIPIAQHLKNMGYSTAGFVSNPFLAKRFGFGRGMDCYSYLPDNDEDALTNVYANDVVGEALEWMRKKDREPFFLFLHLMDIHFPVASTPFNRLFPQKFLKGHDIDEAVRQAFWSIRLAQKTVHNKVYPNTMLKLPDGSQAAAGDVVSHYKGLYDGALYFLDMCLENLFNDFKERGLYDRTLFIVTSDHGEEFLEEGFVGHHELSEASATLVQVPFIMKLPKAKGTARKNKRVARLARLADVYPTILGQVGLTGVESDGFSLLPLIEGTEEPERLQHINLCHLQTLHVIYSENFKYVFSSKEGWEKLISLDTGLKIDASSKKAEKLLAMFRMEKDKFLLQNESSSNSKTEESGEENENSVSQLRSLGYID